MYLDYPAFGEMTPVQREYALQKRWREEQTILVPLDGSRAAERSLPFAVAVARRGNAALRLVHVRLPQSPPDDQELLFVDDGRALMSKLRSDRYLEGLADTIQALYQIPVTVTTIPRACVADGVSSLCDSRVALVVVAQSRRSALSRWLWGSTTHRLLGRVPAPLLMVPATVTDYLPPVPSLRRWLIPLDGTKESRHVLSTVAPLAAKCGAECHVLRVLPLMALSRLAACGTGGAANLRSQAWFELLKVRDCLETYGVEAHARVVFDGVATGPAIVAHARAVQSDLVVMTGRPSSISACWRSRVPRYVAQHAGAPLLFVPTCRQSKHVRDWTVPINIRSDPRLLSKRRLDS